LDVSFSYGGLSTDEGHPETLCRMLLGFGMYSDTDADDLEGNAFYDVTTIEQLDEKWDHVLGTEPDFLKLYLLQHDTEDSAGLSEGVFREAARRANALGMRTTVHLETVQDLALAVDARATEAAHLPAYDLSIAKDPERSRVPDALIDKMAAQGFIVVATTNVSQGREYSEEDLRTVTDQKADNLRRMKAAGVPIAVGSDSYFQTAWNEIQSLKALDVFTDEELLALWIRTPALSIFPGRAIGALEPGYEASFLALDCDPTSNIACASEILHRVKNGQRLDIRAE
jgi:imidazolonepropionase-like amidohydrolase